MAQPCWLSATFYLDFLPDPTTFEGAAGGTHQPPFLIPIDLRRARIGRRYVPLGWDVQIGPGDDSNAAALGARTALRSGGLRLPAELEQHGGGRYADHEADDEEVGADEQVGQRGGEEHTVPNQVGGEKVEQKMGVELHGSCAEGSPLVPGADSPERVKIEPRPAVISLWSF